MFLIFYLVLFGYMDGVFSLFVVCLFVFCFILFVVVLLLCACCCLVCVLFFAVQSKHFVFSFLLCTKQT